ncbi:2-polyprenylphenol 6-hydroxylase [Sneathiella glossodoripedis]|uniref:2-polyprenylphenol 6-hydroxylase n=1 Tax=Sneathiella glossodoripedis TaxID=418853 RepID=UPI000472AC14|nr:2-polyprenylphenol 6-hydroxylase [Sneathiella glossodoripedis]
MFNGLRNFFRLLWVLRILAKHDALFLANELERAPFHVKLGLFLLPLFAIGAKSSKHMRKGERLARALQELGPSFIKLGQALSVRSDLLGEEISQDLGNLRDKLPPFSFEEAKETIEFELGEKLDDLFVSFDEKPVAAASIAQVHFAEVAETVAAPTPEDPEALETFRRKVAVKVLRPGIEDAFERDLRLFFWVADMVERFQPAFRRLRLRKIVEILEHSVSLEMDLRLEAAAAAEMGQNFENDPDFDVPKIDWQRTGKRVMTQSRVDGIALSDRDALQNSDHDLEKLSANVIRVFLHQVLRDGFFHADMHHGNLFVTDAGTLVAVDFGIMGRMDRQTRLFMAEMLYAFLVGDYRRAAEVHFEAGYVPPDKSLDAFTQACRAIGEPILGKPVSEISIARLLVQLFQTTETFEMETQPQLLLLQKTMVTAEGVAQSLNPDVNFWEVSHPTVENWMRENMGPEAKLADIVNDGLTFAKKIPGLVNRADRLLSELEEKSGGKHEQSGSTGSGGSAFGKGWMFLIGAASGAIGLYVFLSV